MFVGCMFLEIGSLMEQIIPEVLIGMSVGFILERIFDKHN